jgi:hypothetical protein
MIQPNKILRFKLSSFIIRTLLIYFILFSIVKYFPHFYEQGLCPQQMWQNLILALLVAYRLITFLFLPFFIFYFILNSAIKHGGKRWLGL